MTQIIKEHNGHKWIFDYKDDVLVKWTHTFPEGYVLDVNNIPECPE